MWATDFLCRHGGMLASAAVLLCTVGARSQPAPTVTEADIERARRAQPTITEKDMERARKTNRMPSDAELGRVPISGSPKIDALPQPRFSAPIDLEALAKGYASQSDAMAQAQGLVSGPGLLVFVSLSMPEATLQRLVDQAARAKASVVIRGLVNGSIRDTAARVQGLIGQRQVAVQIDPQAFDRYAIDRVPSFVLVRDGTRPTACVTGLCVLSDGFARAAGDVSLGYALEHMQRSAPRFAKDASGFLKRLKG